MSELSREKGEPVSGSLLMGLDTLREDFFDSELTVETDYYVITDADFVALTDLANNPDSEGTSRFSIEALREGAAYAFDAEDYSFTQYSGKPLTVTVRRSVKEDETMMHLGAVEVNGRILTPETDYTVSGSTEIILNADYLSRLAPGIYSLTFVPDDCIAVTVPLSVNGAALPASAELLCTMAVKDFAVKNNGSAPAEAVAEPAPNGMVTVHLSDEAGTELAVYTVDAVKGTGNDQDGAAINLPQTGSSDVTEVLFTVLAVMMTGAGAVLLFASRRKRSC